MGAEKITYLRNWSKSATFCYQKILSATFKLTYPNILHLMYGALRAPTSAPPVYFWSTDKRTNGRTGLDSVLCFNSDVGHQSSNVHHQAIDVHPQASMQKAQSDQANCQLGMHNGRNYSVYLWKRVLASLTLMEMKCDLYLKVCLKICNLKIKSNIVSVSYFVMLVNNLR
jgi:hypothetical protein